MSTITLVEKLSGTDNYLKQKLIIEELYQSLQKSHTVGKESTRNKLFNKLQERHLKLVQQNLKLDEVQLAQSKASQKTNISEFFQCDKDVICSFIQIIFDMQFGWTDKLYGNEELEQLTTRQNLGSVCENFIIW